MASASGLTSMTACSPGPTLSICSIRFRYCSVMERDVYTPCCIFCCNSSIVASFSANSVGAAGAETAAAAVSVPLEPPGDPQPAAASAVNDNPVMEEFRRKFLLFISISGLQTLCSVHHTNKVVNSPSHPAQKSAPTYSTAPRYKSPF